jgi:hypothetical protein
MSVGTGGNFKNVLLLQMSTIIIPGGGGMGLGIASLAGNLIALIILIMVVKYFWKKVQIPDKPVNITEELMKYNVDARGLFGKSPAKETYITGSHSATSADVFTRNVPLIEY